MPLPETPLPHSTALFAGKQPVQPIPPFLPDHPITPLEQAAANEDAAIAILKGLLR